MKRALIIGFVLVSLTVCVTAEVKVGVVNPQKILVETIRGKQVKENLEKVSKAKQADIQKK